MEEKVKKIEVDLTTVQLTSWSIDDFTFNVRTSQTLLDQTSRNEWVVYSRCTHHMAKYTSLFSSLDSTLEENILVVDDFSLDIPIHGDVVGQHG